jgi:hypothetical protein
MSIKGTIMQPSHKRIILDSLRKELYILESAIEREKYFVDMLWTRSLGKNTNTDNAFKDLNEFKKELNKLTTRKQKIVSTIKLVKTL